MNLRTFARMARASGFTREEAEARLRGRYQNDPNFQQELDTAYEKDVNTLQRMFLAGVQVVAEALVVGDGRNLDARGVDDADRAAMSVLQVMGDEDLESV